MWSSSDSRTARENGVSKDVRVGSGAVPAAMIEVLGLRKSLRTGTRELEILKGIEFTVNKGEFVAIMGSSGISYLAEDKLAQIRGRTLGFVFQSYQLIPTLTALENVLLPHELNMNETRARGAGLERARGLLEAVGLKDRLDHYPVQLSGGEQQRVALARAFVLRPPIVLADEPTGNLDSVNGQQVLKLLVDLNQVEGTTLVLVTHDSAVAALAHRRITLKDGAIIGDERVNAALDEPSGVFEVHSASGARQSL